MDGLTNLRVFGRGQSRPLVGKKGGVKGTRALCIPQFSDLPPMKCRPLKYLTKGFGAVRLTKTVGLKVLPKPDFGGPSSIFQDDGASTDVTGSLVSSRAWITAGNGSRTSPEKLNPVGIISLDIRQPTTSGEKQMTNRRWRLRCGQ